MRRLINTRGRCQPSSEHPKIQYPSKEQNFHKRDLVWQKLGDARRDKREGNMTSNGDGPYRIVDTLQNGAYKLQKLNDKLFPRTWNATYLKFYFS